MDLQSLSAGLALFKSGMEGIRTALGTVRDVRELIPEDKRTEVEGVLEASERQLQIAEAQIAKGLGFTLCNCDFPPTPMLTVGWTNGRGAQIPKGPVNRCPKCGITDNGGWSWTPTEDISSRATTRLGAEANRD